VQSYISGLLDSVIKTVSLWDFAMKGPLRVGWIPAKTQKTRTQIYMDLGYMDPHMGGVGGAFDIHYPTKGGREVGRCVGSKKQVKIAT